MGRVAKYKKVKKFDLHDDKREQTTNMNRPIRKQKNQLPHSFRAMKFQKERMLRREAKLIAKNKEMEAPKVEPDAEIDPKKKEAMLSDLAEQKHKEASVIQFEGKRDDETMKEFNKRLTEQTIETLSNIRVRKRARSNYLRHRKEKKRDKKRKKKEQTDLDKRENVRDDVAFGDIVDRPPCLRAAPKMRKKS